MKQNPTVPTPGISVGEQRLDQFIANPRRALWILSLPIMFGMTIQTLYMIVDMVFVGMVSADALTALAFNMPLVFLFTGTAFGLGSGVTALVAQAIGGRDTAQATRVAEHALVLAGVLTVTSMVIALVFGKSLLLALGVPTPLLGDAWSYFSVLALGYPFMMGAIFFRSILSGEGEVRIPVMIQVGATLANTALDPLFIFVLDLGVQGAALATIAAQALAAIALFYLLFVRRKTSVQLHLHRFTLHRETVLGIVRIGVPASLSFLVMAVGGGIFNRILVSFSTDAVAAHQVGLRLDHVVILPMIAMSASLVTLVGMFYGARRADLLIGIVRYALVRAVVLGIVIGAAFYVAAPYLVSIFTTDEAIRELGVRYLRVVVFAYPFAAVAILTGRALQGLGSGTPELVLSTLRVLLIAAPLAMFFGFVLDLPVQWVWIAMVIGSGITASIAIVWLTTSLRRAVDRCRQIEESPSESIVPALAEGPAT